MVNQNSLKTVYMFIIDNRLSQMRNWNRRLSVRYPRHKNYKEIVRMVQFLLNFMSGGNKIAMLKSVLNKTEIESLVPNKYKDTFKGLVIYFNLFVLSLIVFNRLVLSREIIIH
jgi:hypothetical protein